MAFCSKPKVYTDQPQQFDPLGAPNTGGGAQRSRIFSGMERDSAQSAALTQDYIGRAQAAASNPAWQRIGDFGEKTLRGDYLSGSPQLDAAMAGIRSRAMASAADQEARIKSQFGRSGMGFSTGYQQASQANAAAAAADAARTEAGARLQDYQTERGYQNAAPGTIATSLSTPLSYLAGLPASVLAQYAQQAGIVKDLAGGGQVVTPSSAVVNRPGVGDNIAKGIGSL